MDWNRIIILLLLVLVIWGVHLRTMRELSAIGNRINQLAVKANALGFVDTPMLREEARKWHEFQIDIRKRYLLPRRSS